MYMDVGQLHICRFVTGNETTDTV